MPCSSTQPFPCPSVALNLLHVTSDKPAIFTTIMDLFWSAPLSVVLTLPMGYTRDHVTNEEMGNRIRQAIGPYEDLLTTVKKRKLRWYGHKTRSTGLAKMILQGTVQGGRRRGRQKKRWEDNVTEWTGLKLGEALRKAENREEWRTVVARSSLVPQQSTRLRDK